MLAASSSTVSEPDDEDDEWNVEEKDGDEEYREEENDDDEEYEPPRKKQKVARKVTRRGRRRAPPRMADTPTITSVPTTLPLPLPTAATPHPAPSNIPATAAPIPAPDPNPELEMDTEDVTPQLQLPLTGETRRQLIADHLAARIPCPWPGCTAMIVRDQWRAHCSEPQGHFSAYPSPASSSSRGPQVSQEIPCPIGGCTGARQAPLKKGEAAGGELKAESFKNVTALGQHLGRIHYKISDEPCSRCGKWMRKYTMARHQKSCRGPA